MRPLQRSDYKDGMLDVLRVLTTVGDIGEKAWDERYDWLARRGDEYYILVVCDGQRKVVGTGAVIIERKFIHNLGMVGHIEDIAVAKDQQGKKLGLRIIEALDYIAQKVGCYKVRPAPSSLDPLCGAATLTETVQTILDCSETNEGFYVKCGYKRTGLEMALYYDKK
ncbi:MAG: hypothetical protein LQ346_008067 [Caloplaca aetnensis]|nr:MAG: hypothetical protein LQ346_008067 [Caloplaca aetnensis]